MRLPRWAELGRGDKLIALGVLGFGTLDWASGVAERQLEHPVGAAVVIVAAALFWTWRPRYPLGVPFALIIASIATEPLTFVHAETGWSVMLLLLAAGSVGFALQGRQLVKGGVAIFAIELTSIFVREGSSVPQDVAWAVGGIAAAIVAGRVIGSGVELSRDLAAQNAALAEERDRLAHAAVADERARIARELHDVVAHSVSVMVVQAGAARRIAPRDRRRAAGAFDAIESTGRDALVEMRRLLGALRPGQEQEERAGIARIAALVDRAHAAGLPVELRVEGEPTELPPDADLAAYRVVQEALTNVIKHAGTAATTVHVGWEPDGVQVAVENERGRSQAIAGSERGLAGMRERVAACGGDLDAGPRESGGFRVSARLPAAEVVV
jgi:signal transduction histidine kinase